MPPAALDRSPPAGAAGAPPQPPGLRPRAGGGTGASAAPRQALPAAVRTGSSVQVDPTRLDLHTPIRDAPAKVVPGMFFLGSVARNALPQLLMDATRRGAVLATASTTAVLAAFGTGPGRVAVADLSKANLAGVQDLLLLARDPPDQEAWLSSVAHRHGARLAGQLRRSLAQAGPSASFERLQERLRRSEIDLFHVDLAAPDGTAGLQAVAPGGFAALYTSNIEMYLAGFLSSADLSREQRQQQLDQYRHNILGLMNPDSQFVHSHTMGAQQLNSFEEARQHWRPTAS
jgi:hypothetical protein